MFFDTQTSHAIRLTRSDLLAHLTRVAGGKLSRVMPAEPPPPRRSARFGPFEADLRSGDLRKDGLKVRLRGRPFDILTVLVERQGELVTRDELRQRLWTADTFVDFEHGLNSAVNRLREALGDAAESPRYVETLPRRGYRFIAPVAWAGDVPSGVSTTGGTPPVEEPLSPEGRGLSRKTVAGAAVAGAVLLALLGGLAALRARRPGLSVSDMPRVAVLPFQNVSGDPGQEYLVDGMTAALTAELAQVGGLRVISRSSVMPYKGESRRLPQIARELAVDAVVEGTVLQTGGRVRVTAQLVDTGTDRQLWARSYERDVADVINLQRELALAIAEGVHATLTPGEKQRLAATATVDPAAYEAYLRGRFAWETMTFRGLSSAVEHYERAIALDPSYAQAYAGLAESYWVMGSAGYESAPQGDSAARARAAARRALELDPGLGPAEAVLGFIEIDYDWNFAAGEARLRRVLERTPSLPGVHVSFSAYLSTMGRFEEAVAEARRWMELDPRSVVATQTLGYRLYYARRHGEAVAAFEKALELDPRSFVARAGLGLTHWQQGRKESALQKLQEAVALSEDSPYVLASLGCVAARLGDPARARGALARLAELRQSRYVPPIYPAIVQVGLGQKDEAFVRLEESFAERSGWMLFLNIEPFFDGVRDDPRFQDLLRRIGLRP